MQVTPGWFEGRVETGKHRGNRKEREKIKETRRVLGGLAIS